MACNTMPPIEPPGPGDGIINGVSLYINNCANCHANNASGNSAPNIRNSTFEELDNTLRDPNVMHTGGKFEFSDQDIEDVRDFLALFDDDSSDD